MNWQWKNPKVDNELEIYTLKPVLVKTDSPESFEGISSLTNKSARVTLSVRVQS